MAFQKSGDNMKWFLYAEPEVYMTSDRHIMKAQKIEDVPEITWAKRMYSSLLPEYSVVSKIEGKGLGLTKKGKVKESYSIAKIESGCAKAYYELDKLNLLLQKTSKLYLAQDDGNLFIQNKNCIYFISASLFDSYLFEEA